MNLFEIINAAKEIQEYEIANVAFAVLLQQDENAHVFGKSKLNVLIETQDDGGSHESETYYDLIRIENEEGSACIPTPLLSTLTVATLYKRGEITERESHTRETREPVENEVLGLWQLLEEAAGGEDQMHDAAATYLSLEEQVKVFEGVESTKTHWMKVRVMKMTHRIGIILNATQFAAIEDHLGD